jgi:hypothetical protein
MTQAEIARRWLERFPNTSPDKVMEQFLPMLGRAWEANKAQFTAQHLEDEITNGLVADLIRQVHRQDGIAWSVRPQSPILINREGSGQIIGRCDLIIDLGGNREYIHECKRLWPENKRLTFTKSARLYVQDGLKRFLQPSAKHPTPHAQYDTWQSFAGMIGYVMDGRVLEACAAVRNAAEKYASPQEMTSPCSSIGPAKDALHFRSVHKDCVGKTIHARHLLFGLPAESGRGPAEPETACTSSLSAVRHPAM